MTETYLVTIEESSMENLTNRDRVMLKDVGDAIALDEALADETSSLEIAVKNYAVLNVHNEKADDKDYNKFIIISTAGQKYVTGSSTFFRSFKDIYSEMAGEDFSIKVYKKPSTNYKGKFFLSCSIV